MHLATALRFAAPCLSLGLSLGLALALAGCSTERLSEPKTTATEQLLVSTAIDHVVSALSPTVPPGSKAFVDPQYFETTPSDDVLYAKYAIGAVRDQLLRQGVRLVDDRNRADVVIEPRSGAQSIDHATFLVGIPSFSVPVPLADKLAFPEIALFKKDQQIGVANLAITAYSEKDGSLVGSTGPVLGYSNRTRRVVLLFYAWTETDAPSPASER
jgi:hypothetical protein